MWFLKNWRKSEKNKIQKAIVDIYKIVNQLQNDFPGRHFTPDGHMVGSIGEVLVAEKYTLKLMPASNKGFDAKTKSGKKVEIKATQKKRVSFQEDCVNSFDVAVVIKINEDGTFSEIYNGPGKLIWDEFEVKKVPKNGQFSIALSRLKKLNELVKENQRII